MKISHLLLATAAVAFLGGHAFADDLPLKVGEDTRFDWKSFEDFKAAQQGHAEGRDVTFWTPWSEGGDLDRLERGARVLH